MFIGPPPSVKVGPKSATSIPFCLTLIVFPFHPSPNESVNLKV